MPEALLSICNLTVGFRQGEEVRTVVHDLSLEIKPGETLALVGESGSGKSVTAQSVLKLLPEHSAVYESGRIEFQNQNLLASDERALQKVRGNKISMIFPGADDLAKSLAHHRKAIV